jgi:hemolysin-activating ACP:hemolysin acyltransferase
MQEDVEIVGSLTNRIQAFDEHIERAAIASALLLSIEAAWTYRHPSESPRSYNVMPSARHKQFKILLGKRKPGLEVSFSDWAWLSQQTRDDD